MGRFFGVLAVGAFLALAASLYSCEDVKAYSVAFEVNYDSMVWNDPDKGYYTGGKWKHQIGSDSVVIAWGHGYNPFIKSDSVVTTYDKINEIIISIPEGKYQFFIYPHNPPAASKYLLYSSSVVSDINQSKVINFAGVTKQFLVLLDTAGTWDFRTGNISQGYQYAYYMTGPPNNNYWPSYFMDYYCGTKGKDSTRFVFQIDSAKAGTIYHIRCNQTFNIGFNIDLLGVMDSINFTLHKK
jgi:hypothetical protein